MTKRQRMRLLLGLLGLWISILTAVFGFSSEPLRVPLQNVTGAAATVSGTRGESRSPGLQVNVKLFEAGRTQRAQHYPPPKNIFVPVSAASGGGLAGAGGMTDPSPEPVVEAQSGSGEIPLSMQFLGFVDVDPAGPRGTVAVVVTGEELHMVRKGDRLGDQFIVKAVTAEALIATDRATGREVRFPLSDMAPVEPAS